MKAGLVVLCIILAGCAQAPQQDDVATVTPAPVTASTPAPNATAPGPDPEISVSLTDCSGIGVLFLVPPDDIRQKLPAGFRLRDAAQLVNLGVDSGYAGVLVATLTCQEPAWHLQSLAIYVEPHPADIEAADRDFYTPLTWMDGPLQAFAQDHGLLIQNATTSLETVIDRRLDDQHLPNGVRVPSPGPSSVRGGALWPPEAEITATTGGATGYVLQNETFRFWNVMADGSLVLDVHFSAHGTGSGATCQVGDDTAYAQYIRDNPCARDGLIGVTVPTTDLEARFRWLPF